MALDLAQFRDSYPEFVNVPDAVIQRYLTEFTVLYTGCYGEYYDALHGYYVAHMLATNYNLKTGQSGGGSVTVVTTGRSVGDVSVSGQAIGVGSDGSMWDGTTYGQMFKNMIAIFGAGPYLTEAATGYGCP